MLTLGAALVTTVLLTFGAASLAADGTAAETQLFSDRVLSNASSPPATSNQGETADLVKLIGDIPGWVRNGEVLTFAKETLYGHIDGGAEIVLQYGFRRLVVIEFISDTETQPETGSLSGRIPETAAGGLDTACLAFQDPRPLSLEIYEMESGEAAFGIYSTKVDGHEETSDRIAAAHWISPGQANFVKGEYLVNILAPDATAREIEDFAADLEPKIPGEGTERPAGVEWLPREGLVPGSERFIKGEAAALNESPLLERPFWGFGRHGTTAFSGKYSPFPSRVAVVDFGRETGKLADLVLELFREYLSDVRKDENGVVEGRSPVGHWFLCGQDGTTGRFAALVLGERDEATARARLRDALERASLR